MDRDSWSTSASEFCNFLCHWKTYEEKIDALAEKLTAVKGVRDDVMGKIDAAEKVSGLKLPGEVATWLSSIDDFVCRATSIVDEYTGRSSCLGFFPLNIFSSFHLGKRADELLQLAEELVAKARDFSSNLLGDLVPDRLKQVLHSAAAVKEEVLEKIHSLELSPSSLGDLVPDQLKVASKEEVAGKIHHLVVAGDLVQDRLEELPASKEEVVEKIQHLEINPAAAAGGHDEHQHRHFKDHLKKAVESASAVKEEVLEKVSQLNPTSHASLGFGGAVKSLF